MSTPPPILRAKLDNILHQGLCFVRNNISRQVEADASVREDVYQVSDALEDIPTLFHRWDAEKEGWVREAIDRMAETVPHLGKRFQMLLDMPDDEYEAIYLMPRAWPGDETDRDTAAPPASVRAA
ncbi:hypothetical protein [Alienimonas californiensis]|uniref:Uncharacterized protein n=1 Tax=Alienimonas californiensis TaxID=2527989 RepID=A0A517P7H5_9PLAN|nr:hypothetical protein [Alienimonas californiensis]QDT15320.1 hypothetical protein CA12_14030 [Alienimonas californiensis]